MAGGSLLLFSRGRKLKPTAWQTPRERLAVQRAARLLGWLCWRLQRERGRRSPQGFARQAPELAPWKLGAHQHVKTKCFVAAQRALPCPPGRRAPPVPSADCRFFTGASLWIFQNQKETRLKALPALVDSYPSLHSTWLSRVWTWKVPQLH